MRPKTNLAKTLQHEFCPNSVMAKFGQNIKTLIWAKFGLAKIGQKFGLANFGQTLQTELLN